MATYLPMGSHCNYTRYRTWSWMMISRHGLGPLALHVVSWVLRIMILILAKYSTILEETKGANRASGIGVALIGPRVTTAVLRWAGLIK